MDDARAATVNPGIAKGSWSEIFRNGLGLYSALVIGGIAMNATQMLVIAIIMPTIRCRARRRHRTGGRWAMPLPRCLYLAAYPFGLAALLMFRFVRITLGKAATTGERRNVSSASP
jgi:hypothetical protein